MKKGVLILITGCMFSGKTTKLIRLAQKALLEKKHIEVYYPEIDTRYKKNYITTHDQVELPSVPLPISVAIIPKNHKEAVFIDELHFFTQHMLPAIATLLEEGVDVVVSGLDKNFRGEDFGIVPHVMKLADEVITLEAKCAVCQKPATYSQRLHAQKEDKTIVIGGADIYEARCKEHFVKPE